MRQEFVTILREVLNNEEVPQKTKELAVELMLEEIGGADHYAGPPKRCVQLHNGLWLPCKSFDEIRHQVRAGNKIAAIKEVRSCFSGYIGLKEAKDFIEGEWDEFLKEKD